MRPVYINALGVISALGRGSDMNLPTLANGGFSEHGVETAGLRASDLFTPGKPIYLGLVSEQIEASSSSSSLPQRRFRSRTNALLEIAAAQIDSQVSHALERYGARRVAAIVGVSAAGLLEGESANRELNELSRWPSDFDYAQQEMGNAAAFVAHRFGIEGPRYGISTACSSGAKAFAAGARLLRAGIVDAVVVGGADALCGFTIGGFSALESVSADRCNPMSRNRNGINIGEGAALFLMTRDASDIRLSGYGETSDAHHMSAPDPSGRGAADAMRSAIAMAGLQPADIDYVNMHGTATPHNDAMESLAIAQVIGSGVATSSTKPMTGHTLAAAGAVEAAMACAVLADNPSGLLPVHLWDGERDASIASLALVSKGESLGRQPRHVLSNSFAFGGSNAALVFSRD